MELQLALDFVTLDEAMAILREVADCIDIVEVGTPLIVKEGVRAVTAIKREFPMLRVLADLKIMDAGEHETRIAIDAGADIVTVLGVSDDTTIQASLEQARGSGTAVMVDMIGVRNLEQRAQEIDAFGVPYLCVHTAFDVQASGKTPLDELKQVRRIVRNARIAVAGGIRLSTIGEIVEAGPDVVIVGGGITGHPNRREAALELRRVLHDRGE